jgi:hypothetical protein
MKPVFVVFRVRDGIEAAVLLETVRAAPHLRIDGVEMTPAELRDAAMKEITEAGDWTPPPAA